MKDLLPSPVYDAISEHLLESASRAVEGWEGGSDDEDVLTGDLGAVMRTDWAIVAIPNSGSWSWRVRYKKFRGRGLGAFEKKSGADGIFQVEIDSGSTKQFKGMLFQAKKTGRRDEKILIEQVECMETLARSGSSIFVYDPGGYRATSGDSYLQSPRREFSTSLGRFLVDEFLPCDVGIRGMYFDAVRGLLVLPRGTAYRVTIGHRIGIQVKAADVSDLENRACFDFEVTQ